MLRKTFAVVDLSKIAHNIRVLQKNMGEGVLPMAVVKANAYGHGVRQVAKTPGLFFLLQFRFHSFHQHLYTLFA